MGFVLLRVESLAEEGKVGHVLCGRLHNTHRLNLGPLLRCTLV